MVSADHYISRAPGRLYHTKRKSYQSDMFSGGCVFIDHASGYVSINQQVAINATETVMEKITFEREAQSQGLVIKGYHTGIKSSRGIIFCQDRWCLQIIISRRLQVGSNTQKGNQINVICSQEHVSLLTIPVDM